MSDVAVAKSKGWLPSLIYPQTVKDAQAQLLAALNGTNASICSELSDAMKSGWNSFYQTAVAFCNQEPGYFGLGSMMDRLESYQSDLYNWQQLIQQSKCTLTVPSVNPNPADVTTPALISLAQWGVYALMAVAGAYVVGEVVSVVVPVEKVIAAPAKAAGEARRFSKKIHRGARRLVA